VTERPKERWCYYLKIICSKTLRGIYNSTANMGVSWFSNNRRLYARNKYISIFSVLQYANIFPICSAVGFSNIYENYICAAIVFENIYFQLRNIYFIFAQLVDSRIYISSQEMYRQQYYYIQRPRYAFTQSSK
jgi:hypothetical protein